MATSRIVQFVAVVALVFLGWAVGRAQTSAPAFELLVEAPTGETTITCVKGCELVWVERGVNVKAKPTLTFSYQCNVGRCLSGRVGGWLSK